MKLNHLTIQIRAPRGDDPGQVAEGIYTLDDGVVSLTDRYGVPVVDRDGKTYTQKLEAGENPYAIACRLTREFRRAFRADKKHVAGFTGPINYPKLGHV